MDKTALIVGVGGLGCPAAVGLAEAGVGRLILVDPDVVDLSNLQRQVLYGTPDVGRPKAIVAAERLRARYPGVDVTARVERVTGDNLPALLALAGGADVALDCTDDPEARFWVNDAALAHGVPSVIAGLLRYQGLVVAVPRDHGPCFRCLFEEPPGPDETPTCAQVGVLGAVAGAVGHLQARRALGLLRGEIATHTGFATAVDGLAGRVRSFALPVGTQCPSCGGLDAQLDVTDDECPMPYVRSKLALEALAPGQTLEILTRTGQSAHNVPLSLLDDGHRVLARGPAGGGGPTRDTLGHYRIVVRKGGLGRA